MLEQDKVGVMLFSDGDLDHTSLVTHDLLLLDDVPMRQRYRRMPPSNYDDVRARICQSTVIREWQPVCLSHRPSSSKKDSSLQLCVDCRLRNSETRKAQSKT